MTLKATIFKSDLQVSDLDRDYYHAHSLTIARHPSETDERMMVRLLAFALHADDQLSFTKGLCVDDEPDLWRKDLSGDIELWIDLGQPSEKRIRKACGRARQVVIYTYQSGAGRTWWQQVGNHLERFENLQVFRLPEAAVKVLGLMAGRNMQLQCTIQEQQVWLGNGELHVEMDVESLL